MSPWVWKTPDGITVEVITLTGMGQDDGQWFAARLPNGRTCSSLSNPRGWVRTIEELKEMGIDISTLTEVCRCCHRER